MSRRAAIYTRISDDREGTGLGVERQEQDCRELLRRLGWEFVDLYVDNDVSAYDRRRERPDWQRLLRDLQAERVDAVVTWHPDRLYRQMRDLLALIDLCDRDRVKVVTVMAGDVDLSTATGRAVAKTVAAWNEHESEHKAERARRKAQELAAAGKISGGGTRPYGYEVDRLTILEHEAEIVRELAGRALDGEGVRTLCRDLDRRGVLTTTGKQWQAYTLSRMLQSARISGRREHNGVITANAIWPAIISAEMSDRLRQVLNAPERRTTPGAARRHLLSGIAQCGRCDHPLLGRPREDGKVRYVCDKRPNSTRCGKTFALAEPLDDYIVGVVLAAVDSPGLLDAMRRGDQPIVEHAAVAERLAAGELRQRTLAEDFGAGRIHRDEWLVARDAIQAQLDADRQLLRHNTSLHAIEKFVGQQGTLTARWDGLDLDRRRAILTAVVDGVVVHAGRRGYNRFDPARYEIRWRF